MGTVTAIFHNGQIELAHPVDWPEGTHVDRWGKTPLEADAHRESATDGNDARQVSLEEFEAGLDELASASDSIPVLPPEAYTRESIYGGD